MSVIFTVINFTLNIKKKATYHKSAARSLNVYLWDLYNWLNFTLIVTWMIDIRDIWDCVEVLFYSPSLIGVRSFGNYDGIQKCVHIFIQWGLQNMHFILICACSQKHYVENNYTGIALLHLVSLISIGVTQNCDSELTKELTKDMH